MKIKKDDVRNILENFMIWYEHDDAARQKMSECINKYIEEGYYE
jgi:hypothetical protein